MLPDRVVTGDLIIEDGVIAEISPNAGRTIGACIDGDGLTILPGLIDTTVRWSGVDDVAHGSMVAAMSGVTTALDLPDDSSPTTSLAALHDKLARAAKHSVVHFGAYLQATDTNLDEVLAAERAAAVRVSLCCAAAHQPGASQQAGIALRNDDAIEALFSRANRLLAVHAADEARVMERAALYADQPDPKQHSRIYDVEAACIALRRVLELSARHGRRVHLQGISSAEELQLLAGVARERVSVDVGLQHLLFQAETAYEALGSRAITTPPLRGARHGEALWKAIDSGVVQTVSSHHTACAVSAKDRPYPATASGFPAIEHLLPAMLDQVARGRLTLCQLARLTSEQPATAFRIPRKGRLEVGYDGDLAIVDTQETRVVSSATLHSRAGWSPFEGYSFTGWLVRTVLLGRTVWDGRDVRADVRGREINPTAR